MASTTTAAVVREGDLLRTPSPERVEARQAACPRFAAARTARDVACDAALRRSPTPAPRPIPTPWPTSSSTSARSGTTR